MHGGGVHSNKKRGAAQEPGELGPVCRSGRCLNPRAEKIAERVGGFDLAGFGAAADEEPGNKFEQLRDQGFPAVQRPGLAFPTGVEVEHGELRAVV